MADIAFDTKTKNHNLDQLLASLEKKEKELALLNKMYNETDSEMHKMQAIVSGLNGSLTQLQLNYTNTHKALETLAQKVEQIIDANEKTHSINPDLHEENNQASLKNITYKQKAMRTLKKLMPIALIKSFFYPRIGVLHQYGAKPFFKVPKRYKKPVILTHTPLISIVTPSYNQGQFIERTILSVLNQRYPALEYIIQDGGSKDETLDILKRYEPSLKHLASAPDKGQSCALNLGFKHASGDIMAYLNSDDILLTGALFYVANYFNEHPDVDVVYGHRVIIDEYDLDIGRWVLPPHDSKVLSWADFIPQETLFWRKSIWEKAGACIDESFRFAMDWDLLLRFREAGAKFARLPRFLGAFRMHSHQKTSCEMTDTGMREMNKLRLRVHGRYITHHEIRQNIRLYQIKHILCHRLYKAGILRY